MKRVYFVVFVLLGILSVTSSASAQVIRNDRPQFIEPSFTLESPRAGDSLRAGNRITVRWNLVVDESIVNNNWSEMELFLVDDNGLFLRITPQLSVTTKTFEWVVPSVNSRSAKIMLQVGIEGEGDFYELRQVGTFSIKSKVWTPIVLLNALERTPKAGENMEITWTHEQIDQTRGFDVMISYDRGAHFFKAGTTTESRFTLPIDEDFAGSITVKIIARTADGTKVASLLTPDATFRVKSAK